VPCLYCRNDFNVIVFNPTRLPLRRLHFQPPPVPAFLAENRPCGSVRKPQLKSQSQRLVPLRPRDMAGLYNSALDVTVKLDSQFALARSCLRKMHTRVQPRARRFVRRQRFEV
jgi:hypothetical protein